jgi:uncharacterized membrane protein YiaA
MDMMIAMKVSGVILLLAGAVTFLFGMLLWDKFWMATGFMAIIIAGALLYYVWQQDRPKDLS